MSGDPRRSIPSVEALVADPSFAALRDAQPRERVTAAVRAVIDELRAELAEAGAANGVARDAGWFALRVARRLAAPAHSGPRRVINATGVVLHTNLGRAPLAASAVEAVAELAGGYLDLEYDLETGERGSRYVHCAGLLCELTGAESALVVNNNAAALVLCVNTLAAGRDVVVSRGELVEIGGSFRIAEIIERSGGRLVEVGASNRTRLADYERALSPRTGAILKVHRSNFVVSGFVEEVEARALASLGRAHDVPVIHDLGSGLLGGELPFDAGPTARAAMADGVDLVTMSGDKLLGGPQAGILLGADRHVAALRANPLCRALRPDRLTIAALQATLALHAHPESAVREIPTLRMLAAQPDELRARAEALVAALAAHSIRATTRAGDSAVGGGAAPDQSLPTTLVALESELRPDELLRRLRAGTPPVVARISDQRVVLDPRTVADAELDALIGAVAHAAAAP